MMAELSGFSCVLMRMTGCVLFNPILGRRNFPALFKAGLILMFSLIIMTYDTPHVALPDQFLPTTFVLLSELFIGFVLGFIVSLFSYIVLLTGQLIDLQMGLSMSNIYDPQNNMSMSLTATYFNLLFLFLFFALNGHIAMIKIFLTSSQVVGYGEIGFLGSAPQAVLDTFVLCTELAIKLALPLVAIQFLLEMGVGILMKAIPQINVFVVNLQAKILVGLVAIVLVFSSLAGFIDQMIVTMLDTMQDVLRLL